ncbi:cytochrome P450 [Pseudonocardia kujensis]|uniref:cytochrome P450 n=1 Tax=Pseudonocardia kujensis TaxID=1128675 RepID=UPI001E3BB9D9|nr:cytochrome P450 [Pseudonocardia kujensis]MCE0761960.1 cytochrome P450 [Pseudonocardia kujensis]
MSIATHGAAQVDLSDLAPFLAGREHELFREIREHDPLHWNTEPNDGPGYWSLTRYADLITAIEDPATFVNGQGTQIPSRRVEGHTPTVHNTDPPRHTELRKVATPHLRAVKVKEWQDLIETSVSTILDDIERRGEVELVSSASAVLPIQVLGQVLGVPAQDCPLLANWTDRVISDDPEFMRSPDEKERAREELFDYFRGLTEARRAEPRNDIVSKLVAARIGGEPLSWEDLAAYYFVLVGAGNETTRNLLTGAVLAFAEFPGEWERLRADRALLRPAIEELLRFITPIRAMRRTATKDVEWHGRTIRTGDKVVLWFQAANRDPEVFAEPDTLTIDRTPNQHLGFGWGIHTCLGSHLARAEVSTFLRHVLERDLRIVPVAEPDRLHTNQFHAFKRLRVRVEQA